MPPFYGFISEGLRNQLRTKERASPTSDWTQRDWRPFALLAAQSYTIVLFGQTKKVPLHAPVSLGLQIPYDLVH